MSWSRVLTVLSVLACSGCGNTVSVDSTGEAGPARSDEQITGHDRMLRVLSQIATEADFANAYTGSETMEISRERLKVAERAGASGRMLFNACFNAGVAELKYGALNPAITHLQQALDCLDNPVLDRDNLKKAHFYLGVANLRLAETENCCARNTSDSCIVPIRGGGIHTRPQGSRQAIHHFTEVLKLPAPDDDQKELLEMDHTARWLINIAYMTLGEYPQGVPEDVRISSSFFESEADFPRFRNVYPKLNLNTVNLCGGAVVGDFNNDDYLDIMTCTWDPSGQTQLFFNNRDGTYREATEEAGLKGFTGGLNLVQADYDNDGDLDVFIMRGAWLRSDGQHPNSLLANDGRGHFTDVTFEAGLARPFAPTKSAAWADYDNDGDLDLYVANEATGDIPVKSQLFRNNGDRTFTDVAAEAGVDEAIFGMGCTWGDYNTDGFPDLYVSLVGPNRLYRNNRDGTFTDVAEELNVTAPGPSFAVWFWDYNNDGYEDIYASCTSGPVGVLVSDIRFELMHLYQGEPDGTFRDVTSEVQLDYPAEPMGANFGDLNNDGYLDFYLATGNVPYWAVRPNVMFLNSSAQSFQNVTMAGGFGHLQKGHGVSFADMDNDGDNDVYVQLGGAYRGDKFSDALFENPGFENNSITIELEGRTSNRSAIGARIKLMVTERGNSREIYRHVNSGGSFGANPLRQTIGIGNAERIDSVQIDWPASETRQVFTDVRSGQAIHIREGAEEFTEISVKQLVLGGGSPEQ